LRGKNYAVSAGLSAGAAIDGCLSGKKRRCMNGIRQSVEKLLRSPA
jgi:hypothetical protein